MPIETSRQLTGQVRTAGANRRLGVALAFIAGATNAGAFLAVQQYTSHMTGMVSSMADSLVLGNLPLAASAFGALLSFLVGAATSAILVNLAKRRGLKSQFALPLLLEAVLLLLFGLIGAWLATIQGLFVPATVMLLCFIMGLQNALITKISRAEIRTTHVTGLVTDIGIELGKLVYWNRLQQDPFAARRGRSGSSLGCSRGWSWDSFSVACSVRSGSSASAMRPPCHWPEFWWPWRPCLRWTTSRTT